MDRGLMAVRKAGPGDKAYSASDLRNLMNRSTEIPSQPMPDQPDPPAQRTSPQLEATPQIGVPIPAEAGALADETNQPLQPGLLAEQLARAQANERQLEPLKFDRLPAAAPMASVIEKPLPDLSVAKPRVRPVVEAAEAPAVVAPAPEREPSIQPAASNSDSPSRGIPGTAHSPHRAKEMLTPVGGFGIGGDGEYYPLQGHEVLELARLLLDEVAAKIANDLRFSMAVCYPKLGISLTLAITNEIEDVNFEVRAVRREFNEQDQPETPADALREELGIAGPRKQYVAGGAGQMLVDVTN